MENYYIYCNTNQVYNMLIINSIISKVATREDFKSNTMSFLSDNYIFVTKELLSPELRATGIEDNYYPVVLEVTDIEDNSSINAKLVTKDLDDKLKITEEIVSLSEYSKTSNCCGAFVFGDIPISCLSGILFESEDKKLNFRKSSPDLWFPVEMFALIDETKTISELTYDKIKEISAEVDLKVEAADKEKLVKELDKRNKMKAAIYYGIEATEDWNIGRIKTNIDINMLQFLDGNEKAMALEMQKLFSEMASGKEAASYDDFAKLEDEVLKSDSKCVNSIIFRSIVNHLLDEMKIGEEINDAAFNIIARKCIDIVDDEQKQGTIRAFKVIDTFLHSNMDPDEALKSLTGFEVLRSFMFFIDQQKNSDFLRNACKKLSQNERRYAYIFYGLHNGMYDVDGARKRNRYLEYRIEEIQYGAANIIPQRECKFLVGEKVAVETPVIYGISLAVNVWFDWKESLKILLDSASDTQLEEVYKLMKDKSIPEDKIYSLEQPIVITISCGDNQLQKYEIKNKKDAKAYGTKIDKIVKGQKLVFMSKAFKKYLADEERYQKFYKKNCNMIQKYCRKA